MKEAHLVTVGTSILSNASRRGLVGAECRDAIERLLRGEEVKLSKECRDEIYQALVSSPYQLSAELNAMKGFLEGEAVVDIVRLYATDTPAGRLAAELLQRYLADRGVRVVEVETIPNLGKNFWEGIINLVKRVASDVKKLKATHLVYLNPTGGFKPETAAAIMAASMAGAHAVYYIHEYMRTPVSLPILPVKPDTELMKSYINTLKEIIRRQCREGGIARIPLDMVGSMASVLHAAAAAGPVEVEHGVARIDCKHLIHLKGYLDALMEAATE
ncbi:MAG: putative CRISPR-associated protein [Crenarchaeota archaeon]|nr:putative CRISPR-associated protein [Thermoproteota archaeon]